MNKRFKQLADEAGFVRFSPQEDPHTPIDWSSDYSSELEKFAELIVKECMKVCKKTEQYEVGNQDPDEVGHIRAGAVFCREDIKEHFGVE